jgi:hypothetical protein
MQTLLWWCALLMALAASQEHGRRPLHERRRRPVRDKTARQQAAAARARARGYVDAPAAPHMTEDLLTEAPALQTETTLTEAQREATPTLQKLPANDQRRACAAACASEGKGTVYAQHLRKAGGTLLRQYLARYRCRPFDTIVSKRQRLIQRGVPRAKTSRTVIQADRAFNPQNLLLRPNAVYVTILRDPVARVASAFFADDGVHFENWLEGIQRASQERAKDATTFHDHSGGWPLAQQIHEEVSNYYVQVFSGVAAHPVSQRVYDAAVSTLSNFDVVLILEHLGTPDGRKEAMRLLERALPLPPIARCPPSIRPRPVNAGRKGVLSSVQKRRIMDLNVYDVKLYEHAVNLMNARIASSLDDCVPRNCSSIPDATLNLLEGEDALESCGRLIPRKCRRDA